MAEKYIADKNIHDGHRGRMRAKFVTYGADIFDTYELLEMLLYNVIPYKDTNPIAKRLLYAFGGLDGVFMADKESLMQVDGIGERTVDYIINAGKLKDLLETEPAVKKSPFDDYNKIGVFFRDYFENTKGYKTSLLLLDNDMMPLSLSDITETDCNNAKITPYPFISEAIKSAASVAVIAHTHPFATTYESEGDVTTNHMLDDAFKAIGVKLVEHYIVCGKEFRGFMQHHPLGISSETGVERFLKSKEICLCANSTYMPKTDFSFSGTTEGSYEVTLAASILEPVLGKKSTELAHMLYIKYFSFERALAAPNDSLNDILGSKGTFFVKLLAKITSRRVTDKLTFGYVHKEIEMVEYFKARFMGEPVEKLFVMSLDTHFRVISCDLVTEGTVNFAHVAPRKVLEIAMERSASSVIISHNHPRGNASPSQSDKDLTVNLSRILQQAKITLVDHYIIANSDCYILSKNTFC